MAKGRKLEKRHFPRLPLDASIPIVGGRERFHTKVTPRIKEIAAHFPGRSAQTVKQIATYVMETTKIVETVFDDKTRFKRTASQVMQKKVVDLLHCYDRCHAAISILAAKRILSWIVVTHGYSGLVHSYVEALVEGRIYTIGFREYGSPIFAEGLCEKAIKHEVGTVFVRGLELAELGVKDREAFLRFQDRLADGKVKGTITLPKDTMKRPEPPK